MEHSIVYSIPYIILVLFYLALAAVYPGPEKIKEEDGKLRTRLNVLAVAVFFLFFGFRGFIGDDWTNYYWMYDRCSAESSSDFIKSMEDIACEPGFFLLILFCKTISGGSYLFFQLVCTAITLFLLYRFLKKYVENIPLGFVLYIIMGGFVMSTNLMRNSISILLFANAIHYITNRKALPYYLICVLAVFFHYSSLVYFPLYFFFHKQCPKWLFVVVFCVLNVVFLAHIQFTTPLLLSLVGYFGEAYEKIVESYVEGKYGDMATGISIGYLERLLTAFLMFCYYDKIIKCRKENVVFVNCAIAFFFLNFFFYEFSVFAGRLANDFVMFYWVLWPVFIESFSVKNNKLLFVGFLGLYSVMKIIGLTNLETLRYDNYLTGAQTYEERLYIHQKYEDDEDL